MSYLTRIEDAINTDPYENVYTDNNGIFSVYTFLEKKQCIRSTFSTYSGNPDPISVTVTRKNKGIKKIKKSLVNVHDFVPNTQKYFGTNFLKLKIEETISIEKEKLKSSDKKNKINTKEKMYDNNRFDYLLQNKISENIEQRRLKYLQFIKSKLKISDIDICQYQIYLCKDSKNNINQIQKFLQFIYIINKQNPYIITISNDSLFMIHHYNVDKEKVEKYKFYTINSLSTTIDNIVKIISQGEKDIRKNIKLYHNSLGLEIGKLNKNFDFNEIKKSKINEICGKYLLHWDSDKIPNLFLINSSVVSARINRNCCIIVTTKVMMILEKLTKNYIEYFGIKPILLVRNDLGKKYFVYYISNDSFGYTCRCFDTIQKAYQYAQNCWSAWLKIIKI